MTGKTHQFHVQLHLLFPEHEGRQDPPRQRALRHSEPKLSLHFSAGKPCEEHVAAKIAFPMCIQSPLHTGGGYLHEETRVSAYEGTEGTVNSPITERQEAGEGTSPKAPAVEQQRVLFKSWVGP